MELKDKIMIERLSKLSELQPAEQEEVLRDPDLQAALVENRLLRELDDPTPPAPAMEQALEQAMKRPKSREDQTMSVRSITVSKSWYIPAAAAAAILLLVGVWAVNALNQRPAEHTIAVAGLNDEHSEKGTPTEVTIDPTARDATYSLDPINATTSDGKPVSLGIQLAMTSYLTTTDAKRYKFLLDDYEKQLDKYEKDLEKYNRSQQARVPTGIILANDAYASADRGGSTGSSGRTVLAKPVEPVEPTMPMTVLARAVHDDREGIAAAVVELVTGTSHSELTMSAFREQVRDMINERFDPELGTVTDVAVRLE